PPCDVLQCWSVESYVGRQRRLLSTPASRHWAHITGAPRGAVGYLRGYAHLDSLYGRRLTNTVHRRSNAFNTLLELAVLRSESFSGVQTCPPRLAQALA